MRELTNAAAALDDSPPSQIPHRELQALFAAVVRAYYAKRDAGEDFGPFPDEGSVAATAVCVAAANMLQAADLDPFELGMWARQGTMR